MAGDRAPWRSAEGHDKPLIGVKTECACAGAHPRIGTLGRMTLQGGYLQGLGIRVICECTLACGIAATTAEAAPLSIAKH